MSDTAVKAHIELVRILAQTHIPEAQRLATGSGVQIAVVDSGIDSTVAALRGRVLLGYDATASTAGAQTDRTGHGTAMAGLAAAQPVGRLRGVAPASTVIPVRVVDDTYTTRAVVVEKGLRWLLTQRPDIVLFAYAPERWAPGVTDALMALRDQGAVIVLSAGNLGPASAEPPLAGVLVAASIDANGALQRYSGRATRDGVVVAGGDADPTSARLLAAAPGDATQTVGGTSSSAAIVAGVAALVRSVAPAMSGRQVIVCIQQTATRVTQVRPQTMISDEVS